MADNLPEGFQIDQPSGGAGGLPPGFTIDQPQATSIWGTPVSPHADTYSGTVSQYAKEALRDVGKGWSNLMEATDPRRTTPSPVGTPSALGQIAGGIGRAAISPASALVNPAWEYLTGIPGEKAAEAVMGGIAPARGLTAARTLPNLAARTAPERGNALSIPGTLQRPSVVDMGALERDITTQQGTPAAAGAVPREDVGVSLLPPETPHEIPRASVGAAGSGLDPLSQYSPEAIERVRAMMAENGLDNPNRLEQALSDVSSHHFLGEIAPGLESELGGIRAADKGEAHNLITQSVLERQSEAPQRISAAFDRAFGPARNRAELREAIENDRNRAAAPMWQQFTQTPVSPTPEIRALMPRLEASGALRAANKAMREEGLPVHNAFENLVEGEYPGELEREVERIPTAAAFQYAKEHLDGLIERSLAEPGGAKAARRYTQLKNDLVRAIDNHPDPNVAGVWQAARRAWQEPTELLDAQRLGARIMTNNVHREDLPGLLEGYRPEQMQHLRIGLRGYLEDLERGNRSPARVSNRLLDAVLSPGAQDKLRAVLDPDRADELLAAVRHEDALHGARQRIVGGSPTAERQAARDRWLPQQGALDNLTVGQVVHGVKRPFMAAGEAVAKRLIGDRAKRQAAELERLRDEVARILTTQGPERDALARAIVNAPAEGVGFGGLASRERSHVQHDYGQIGQGQGAPSPAPHERPYASQRGEIPDDSHGASPPGFQPPDIYWHGGGIGIGQGTRVPGQRNPEARQRGQVRPQIGRAEGGPTDDDLALSPQDAALAASMTHWPEQPNPVVPIVQGIKDRFPPIDLTPIHEPGTQPKDYLSELARNPEIREAAIEQAMPFAGMVGALGSAGGQALTREGLGYGRSGRPIQTKPLPIGTEPQILERAEQRLTEGPRVVGSKAEQQAILRKNWEQAGKEMDYEDVWDRQPAAWDNEVKAWNKAHPDKPMPAPDDSYTFGTNPEFERMFEDKYLKAKNGEYLRAPFPGAKAANEYFENDPETMKHTVYTSMRQIPEDYRPNEIQAMARSPADVLPRNVGPVRPNRPINPQTLAEMRELQQSLPAPPVTRPVHESVIREMREAEDKQKGNRAKGGRINFTPPPMITRKQSNYSPTRGSANHHCGPDKKWPHGFCSMYRQHNRCTAVGGFIAARGGCDWYRAAEESSNDEAA